MSRAEKVKESLPVQFLTTQDEAGCACYFVVRATPSALTKLRASKGKQLDIAEHAEILASGYGHTPTSDVRKEFKRKYGLVLPE